MLNDIILEKCNNSNGLKWKLISILYNELGETVYFTELIEYLNDKYARCYSLSQIKEAIKRNPIISIMGKGETVLVSLDVSGEKLKAWFKDNLKDSLYECDKLNQLILNSVMAEPDNRLSYDRFNELWKEHRFQINNNQEKLPRHKFHVVRSLCQINLGLYDYEQFGKLLVIQ